MNISKLIKALQVLKNNHGDLEVVAWHDDCAGDGLTTVYPAYRLNMIVIEPTDQRPFCEEVL